MPDAPKQDNSIILLVGIASVVFLLAQPQKNSPSPGPSSIAGETSKVFPSLRTSYQAICKEAAGLVRNKTLADEEALLKWLAPKTGAAREASFASFYRRLDQDMPTTFEGKEEQVARYLEQIAGAW